jgi:YD repeat-containing protein
MYETTCGTFSYTYDAEGNVITKTGAGQSWEYTYHRRNRLIEATDTSSGYDAQYTYDVFDRRIGVNENAACISQTIAES